MHRTRRPIGPITLTRLAVLSLGMALTVTALHADKKSAPSKPSAPAKASAPSKPAARPTAPAGAHPNTANRTGMNGSHPGGSSTGRPNTPGTRVERTNNGGTVTHTNKGEVARASNGRVTSFKGANGHEAKFSSTGRVKEVHSGNLTVHRGPGNMRRTVVDRPDHSRLVAEGHGRGYIQHEYHYGGHAYYSRAYYYHGGYYRSYYRPYYYHGVYVAAYVPAYYYPPVYYGWAYNPWPAPVAYTWGWGGYPWYGYYGAYFAPYPVYPSAAFWLADYLVAASLADAYAAAAASGDSAELRHPNPAHLVFASYDPNTGTTSPTMTTEVKNAIAEEIKRELAAQKNPATADAARGNLGAILGDGQPHVFVADKGLSVTSSGQDCNLTEGDVLALNAPPAGDAASADLRILASKQADCAKGSVVSVEVSDLQDMYNHLLSNIDKGMGEMKDKGGKGGLPAPPAEAVQGIKEAPYASAAPAADPNGAAELDQQAQQGAQAEQQVVAEANSPDDAAGESTTAANAPPPRPAGPVTIKLGDTPDQVIASKGQPLSKAAFPNKTIFIYSDMKIVFVGNKVSDVQ
jgi:hypothetical protein